jgi:flagellar assembly factor FliW
MTMQLGDTHPPGHARACTRRPMPSDGGGLATLVRPITLVTREITFRREMLGWVGAVHFMLEPLSDDKDSEAVFAALRCTDTVRLRGGAVVPSPQFLVAPPGFFAPRYQISLDEQFAESLDLVVPDDAALLAIVTHRNPIERSTVNLFSPIVVNRHTGCADQYVPASSEGETGWSVRTPLPLALVADDAGGDLRC